MPPHLWGEKHIFLTNLVKFTKFRKKLSMLDFPPLAAKIFWNVFMRSAKFRPALGNIYVNVTIYLVSTITVTLYFEISKSAPDFYFSCEHSVKLM